MSAPRKTTPSYLKHKQSGKARAVWSDPSGTRHQKLLPGKYNSSESLAAHARLALELAISPVSAEVDSREITVAELMLAYLDYADRYYSNSDGKPTKENGCMKAAIKPVRELYGNLPATQFGPLALRAVRQRMIEAGLCRGLINRRIDRVKRVFKWAVAEQLISVTIYEALRTLAGLRRGRTEARESKPVTPVAEAVVKATLPHLPPHVRAMVELLQNTGMRPSEVCKMTLAQVDRSGETWIYRPCEHKTSHHGKDRIIPLGPTARAVLKKFFCEVVLWNRTSLFSHQDSNGTNGSPHFDRTARQKYSPRKRTGERRSQSVCRKNDTNRK